MGWGEGTRTGTEAHGWNGGKGGAPVRGEVKEVRRSPGRATSHCLLPWLQHTPPQYSTKWLLRWWDRRNIWKHTVSKTISFMFMGLGGVKNVISLRNVFWHKTFQKVPHKMNRCIHSRNKCYYMPETEILPRTWLTGIVYQPTQMVSLKSFPW